MILAAMTYSFASLFAAGRIDNAGVARFLAGIGVGAIEPSDRLLPPAEIPALRAALAETGLAVACYDVFADLVTPDPAARADAVATLLAGLERARALGAPRALIVPGALKAGVAPDQARRWVIEGLREVVPRAGGLALTVENLGFEAALCGRSEHIAAICDGAGVRATFDVGNFLFADEDPLAALDALAPRLEHVHLKDWYRDPDGRLTGAPLGQGIVDLGAIAAALRRRGFAVYAAVEYEGPGDPREAVRRGVAYISPVLAA